MHNYRHSLIKSWSIIFCITWWCLHPGDATAAQPSCNEPPAAKVDTACELQLRNLHSKLQSLLSRFTEQHPDVRALRREIEARNECDITDQADKSPEHDCKTPPPSAERQQPPSHATSPSTAAHDSTNPDATVNIDLTRVRQTLHGFGSTHSLNMLSDDKMTDDQWRRTITMIVEEVGAGVGIGPPPVESMRPQPLVSGSEFSRPIDFSAVGTLVRLFQRFSPRGIGDLYPTANINTQHHSWLVGLKSTNYDKYLDEIAGKALMTVADWVRRTGQEPEYLQLWNEPLSGNRELVGGSAADLLATIKHAGQRLRAAGFARVRFVLPNEETISKTLEDLRIILADEQARDYIGAIGYHAYPYGSVYSYIPRLLSIRARGDLPPTAISQRTKLRRLSERFDIPLWMTEVSNGYSPNGPRSAKESYEPDAIDWIVGRAVHIHDEFRYAGASAYFGMITVWSDAADKAHFPFGGSRNLRSQGDHLVLVDTSSDKILPTAMGGAIGHYGRWLGRGARYIEAQSSSPFVLVSAFLDKGQLVTVLVNTATTSVRVTMKTRNSQFSGSATGEVTRAGAYREPLKSVETRGTTLLLDLPAWSVTSIAAPVR